MGFDDILNEWDKLNSVGKKSSDIKKSSVKQYNATMDSFLDLYPPDESSGETLQEKPTERQKRRNYRRMKPQETLDLHGFTLLAAKIELDDFLHRCKRRKIEKILIIHGKGLHSPDGEAVLRRSIISELKSIPFVGEIGHPSEKEGGSGATWAIIKY